MNISQGIIEASRIFPDETAIVFGEQRLGYAEAEDLSSRAAALLAEAGIEKGDRVALRLGNVPAFPVWYYAALRLGAIAVSVNTRLTGEEADFILSDCGAKILVAAAAQGEGGEDADSTFSGPTFRVSEDGLAVDGNPLSDRAPLDGTACADMDPADPATILYTSGTTGFPKGATLSHQNVRATVHAFNHLCGMHRGDRLLLAVPLFHCYGQNAILNAGLNVGATIVMQRRFDLTEAKGLLREHRVTKLFGVPTTFQLMLNACEPEDLESIDYCFSAAATLAPQLGDRWHEKFGLPIHEGYGLTETAPFASYNHRLKHVPGSIGMPVDLVEMKVVDPETGETCPPGVPGEIAVRGPNVMLGYWNRPEETAEAVRDGWFYSGDVGTVDAKGYYYLVDRIKDMIAVGGMKVFPSEVERVLLDAPAVADCAVVGRPDPIWGEEVVAFVVAFVVASAEKAAEAEPIRAHCLEHLAAYKVPSRLVFVDELPRNPAGKVLKKELRSRDLEGSRTDIPVSDDSASSAAPKASMPDDEPGALFHRLQDTHASARQRTLAGYLQEEIRVLIGAPQPPALDAALLETGMDSIMMVNLATRLQHQLGPQLELPATLVFDYPRIADLASHLLQALDFESPASGGPESVDQSRGTTDVSEQPAASIDDLSEEEAMEALKEELKQ
ncbi:MAG: AMP-binding protein [Verrucomicrobiales bacterium]